MNYRHHKALLALPLCLAALLAAACASGGPNHADQAESASSAGSGAPALISKQSANGFASTVRKLRGAIDSRGFKTFAVVDHAVGAGSIGQKLRPTTLFIFGNPKGGTPLMQSVQEMGIELPLKMLAYEDSSGAVMIAWPDMGATFKEYGVVGREPILEKVTGALAAIAAEAAG